MKFMVIDIRLNYCQRIIDEADKLSPENTLFVAEGSGKNREIEFTSTTVLEKLAQQTGISIINPVRNLSNWQVVEEIIDRGRKMDPPLFTRADNDSADDVFQ